MQTPTKNITKYTLPLNLVPVSEQAVSGFSLSKETKDFLVNIGLPNETDKKLKDLLLLTFYHSSPKIREIALQNNKYIIIGDQEEVLTAIDQATNEVYAVDETGETWSIQSKLINSSVQNLMHCLGVYLSHEDKLVNANDAEAKNIVNSIRQQFSSIDAKALADENSFWSTILEQVEQGLM